MDIPAITRTIDEALEHYRVVRAYYQALPIDEAVRHAGSALQPNDRGEIVISGHQRRLGYRFCETLGEQLMEPVLFDRIVAATNFQELFDVTEVVRRRTARVGHLWSYDTAQKIGFHKSTEEGDQFYPDVVYLQTGSRHGAQDLESNEHIRSGALRGQRFVSADIFPEVLRRQPPYIIENILCRGDRRWFGR